MRLDDVSSDDVASVSFDGVEVFVSMFTETSGGAQPARVIANPAASNTVANRFMSISPGKTMVRMVQNGNCILVSERMIAELRFCPNLPSGETNIGADGAKSLD